MCGRFTLRAPASVIAEQFSIFEMPEWKARYNIAPSQSVPVVRATEAAAAGRELVWLRWGLIPGWASDPAIGHRLINARAESAADKPAFRAAFRRRRCLVVADGYYEWRHSGKARQPYLIAMRDGRPFAFAGLWETWEGPQHSAVESCTILTTSANVLVRPLHDRMPVIVNQEDYDLWLDPSVSATEKLSPLLRPYPSQSMVSHPVSPWVNSPAHDDPRCVEYCHSEGIP